MMSIQVFNNPTKTTMLADLTGRIVGNVSFGTNSYGFSNCRVPLVLMSLQEAFTAFSWPGTPHLVITDRTGFTAWEGRIEDITATNGGVALTAFGYFRSLRDGLYTSHWSVTSFNKWWKLDKTTGIFGRESGRFNITTLGQLRIEPRKNQAFTNVALGSMTWAIPYNSRNYIERVEFSYTYDLPADWVVMISTMSDYYVSGAGEAQRHFTTSTATGATTVTSNFNAPTGQEVAICLNLYWGGSTPYTFTGETGSAYVSFTSVRVFGTTNSYVYGSDIVSDAIDPDSGQSTIPLPTW